VVNVGDSANPLANTAAFRFAALNKGTISHNVIEAVNGDDAYGMILSEGSNSCLKMTIAHNMIQSVITTATGTNAWGMLSNKYERTTIKGNVFDTITSLSVGFPEGAAIGTNSNTTAEWENVAITGNTMYGSDTDISFLLMKALNIANVSITGNVGSTSLRAFVEILGGGGGSLKIISIVGNSFANCNGAGNIDIRPGGATTEGLTIANNTFQTDSHAWNIFIQQFTVFKLSGNTLINDDTTLDNNNIYVADGNRFQIDNNYCKTPNVGVAQTNIKVAATSNRFLIVNNMCDKTGSVTGQSIDTNSAGSTVGGLVVNNFYQQSTDIQNALDYGESGSFVLNGPTGRVFTG
jgi:hypothetical protein